jgi:hypothetical protein
MDVVRETALGGIARRSQLGRGTTVVFTLPIARDHERSPSASPTNASRSRSHRAGAFTSATIQRSEGREFLALRGEPLPLRRCMRLGLPTGAGARVAVVV